MFNFLKRAKKLENIELIKTKTTTLNFIDVDDITVLLTTLEQEYERARSRQKTTDAKPTGYMNGIKFAYELIQDLSVHSRQCRAAGRS